MSNGSQGSGKSAIISRARMEARLASLLGEAGFLEKMAMDKGAKGNLHRAVTSIRQALRIYTHPNVKQGEKVTPEERT